VRGSLSIKPNPFSVSKEPFTRCHAHPLRRQGGRGGDAACHSMDGATLQTLPHARRTGALHGCSSSLSHTYTKFILLHESSRPRSPGLTRGSAPRVAPPRTRQTTTSALVHHPPLTWAPQPYYRGSRTPRLGKGLRGLTRYGMQK
jgi:hypothetical protein